MPSGSAGSFFAGMVCSAEIAAGLLYRWKPRILSPFTPRALKSMHYATAIHGHDIIDLVATYPHGIRLSQLMELVGERYGRSVTFHTCSAMGMDLDGLGREAWWWIANAVIGGKQRSRRWSVDKHGDRGAWRQAMAQRRAWEQSMI